MHARVKNPRVLRVGPHEAFLVLASGDIVDMETRHVGSPNGSMAMGEHMQGLNRAELGECRVASAEGPIVGSDLVAMAQAEGAILREDRNCRRVIPAVGEENPDLLGVEAIDGGRGDAGLEAFQHTEV